MATIATHPLHQTGSVGNTASSPADAGSDSDHICLEVIVEAVGATPTATFALEGSLDGTNWFTVRVVPSDSEVAASSVTYTTTGRRLLFLKNDLGHFYKSFRAVSSANTNVTFQTRLHVEDTD